MMRKLSIIVLGLVFGVVSLTFFILFVGTADADNLQSWSKKREGGGSGRFRLLSSLNNEAVLDKETQLVWTHFKRGEDQTWYEAVEYCYNLEAGGRLGYRLPTAEEIMSLKDIDAVDPVNGHPALTGGHPFGIIGYFDSDQGFWVFPSFWTATTFPEDPDDPEPLTVGSRAWVFDIGFGAIFPRPKNTDLNVWCVRGQHGHDGW